MQRITWRANSLDARKRKFLSGGHRIQAHHEEPVSLEEEERLKCSTAPSRGGQR